jgi:hypothetical protein
MGNSPLRSLHEAASRGNVIAAQEALNAGADVNGVLSGHTPLMVAA